MNQCPKCRAEVSSLATNCHSCGVIVAKVHQQLETQSLLNIVEEKKRQRLKEQREGASSAKTPIYITIFAVAAVALAIKRAPKPFLPFSAESELIRSTPGRNPASAGDPLGDGTTPVAVPAPAPVASETNEADPCAGRNFCTYVYMAPWSPRAREILNDVSKYREAWKDDDRPGMKVIVGWDKPDAIDYLLSQIAQPTFVDVNDRFRKDLKVMEIPTYIVVDAHRKIIARGDAASNWIKNEIKKHPKLE